MRTAPSNDESAQRFFLDESGHTGDLAASAALDFGGQPIFALACVGVGDVAGLVAQLEMLRTKYGCGTDELKSSTLGSRLPRFALDLTHWLINNECSIFIELVEKRFHVVTQLVNRLLCSPYSLRQVDQQSRSQLAELLSEPAFDKVVLDYLSACQSQALAGIEIVLDQMRETADHFDSRIARLCQILTTYARENAARPTAKPHDFLPIPDQNAAGKAVWMLPNLQCLTNVYARINRSRPDGLDAVALIHDRQLQYANVLEDAKALMEKLADMDGMPVVPFADYRLRGRAALSFADVTDEPCLQAADILAGCAMRFARGSLQKKGRRDWELQIAFARILDASDPVRATGVNFVMSDRLLDRLEVPRTPAAPFVW